MSVFWDARLSRRHRLRRLGNRVNLSTALGLAVARVGGCRLSPGPDGLILAEGYRFGFPTGCAFTVGDVVITASSFERLLRRWPHLLRHEGRHSTQWWVCLGLPYLLLYTAATGVSWLRTRDRALGNVFEQHAGLADGGYAVERPRHPG